MNETRATKLTMLVLFLAVIAYLSFYIIQSFSSPFSTTVTYRYTAEETVETIGYFVRNEEYIPTSGNIIHLQVSEGGRAAAGQAVAIAYESQSAVDRNTEIEALEVRLEQLRYALQREGESASVLELDDSIIFGIVSLHATVERESFSGLTTQVQDLKNLVFKRDYTYSDSEDPEQLINSISAQIKMLRAQSAGDSHPITVSRPGTFSSLLDGYEPILTPEILDELTPSRLRILMGQPPETNLNTYAGKLVIGSTYYLAVIFPTPAISFLSPGQTVSVRLPHTLARPLSVEVHSISPSENDESLIVFSCDHTLTETVSLRKQNIEIIQAQHTGLRIPKQALRLNEEDEIGLYCRVGAQTEFKPVRLIYEGEDYYLVDPAVSTAKRLREGDEIIVAAEDVYTGKAYIPG